MVAVLHPTGQGSQIVIDRAVVLVGRASDCDAIIDFSSKISRMHCLLVQVDANYFVRDLGSLNGVRLNGVRVVKEAMLTQGDAVAIGDVEYQFHANVQPAPRVALRSDGGAVASRTPVDEPIEVVEAEIIDDVEYSDDVDSVEMANVPDVIHDVEVVEDVEVIDEIDVINDDDVVEDIEVIDDIEVLDEIEIIDDVQIVASDVKRPRRPPRLR